MGSYLLDWVFFIIFVVGITALNGVITHAVGLILGRKKSSEFVDINDLTQKGWRKMVR